MKNLILNFNERVGLSNFLAKSEGTLGKMTALGKVFEAVAFSEDETGQIRRVDLGGGAIQHIPPSEDFGRKHIGIEDGHREYLLAELASRQDYRIPDIAWSRSVKEKLTAPDPAQ